MNKASTYRISKSWISGKISDYLELVKFRLTMLVVFTAVLSAMIVSGGTATIGQLLILGLGGFLVTGAANTLNQVLERDYDKLMKRTADRPLAAGRMNISEAVLIAGFMSLIGISLLATFNPLTAVLGTLSLISYAFIYTPLKRYSPIAVMVGAIPGALPLLIGGTAIQGEITMMALILFGIQFFWQFPHFWAIAWVADEDYKKAGFFLLPTMNGEVNRNIGLLSFIYVLVMTGVSVVPMALGMIGTLTTCFLVLAGMWFAWNAWKLYRQADQRAAKKLMFASIIYLPIALLLIFIGI